jgi:hypothetical protein
VIAVGISGSREYPRLDLVRLRVRYRVELHGRGNVLFVHGAARGVDRTADEAARELGAANPGRGHRGTRRVLEFTFQRDRGCGRACTGGWPAGVLVGAAW